MLWIYCFILCLCVCLHLMSLDLIKSEIEPNNNISKINEINTVLINWHNSQKHVLRTQNINVFIKGILLFL